MLAFENAQSLCNDPVKTLEIEAAKSYSTGQINKRSVFK